jgi:N-acyl amino acid synthase of PEP-CTERM/exosortase system
MRRLKKSLLMFDEQFEAVLADTPQAREIHYRIRFHVYCLETGYEDPLAYPNGLEQDQWDEHSAHFLVRRRDDGEWIGAMRLVLPGEKQLPIESVCALDPTVSSAAPAQRIAEVSRLCIVEHYRRRTAEQQVPYEIVDADPGRRQHTLPFEVEKRSAQRRHGAEIMFGLFCAAAEYSRELGIDHWFFLTSPVLCRIVERYGVPLIPAGESCLHHGERRPYFVDLLQAWGALRGSDTRMSAWLQQRRPLRRYSEISLNNRGMAKVRVRKLLPVA